MWLGRIEVHDLRNIAEARLEPATGLNVFHGKNAQGKTSLLESVGLLARGRSFRTDDTKALVRHGAGSLRVDGLVHAGSRATKLQVEVSPPLRQLRVDGQLVAPRSYAGRLEVFVYSTDRLRIVRGPMRDRRQFLDRGAGALWPTYRQLLRDYDRVVLQRNASLLRGERDVETWTERLLDLGSTLRQRRGLYASKLQAELPGTFRPNSEVYGVELAFPAREDMGSQRALLAEQLLSVERNERRAHRTLAGPHLDPVSFSVDGRDALETASSGQARSLLLALTLSSLEVYRSEGNEPGVLLLDDLDSELDEERASTLCREVCRRCQVLVTTAHTAWARSLAGHGSFFEVHAGAVKPA